jgi:plastocyanin
MKHNAAIAAVAAALVAAPAMAYGWGPDADGTMRATDPFVWKADGTGASTLTVRVGGTVAFTYASGTAAHNVHWLGKKPSCTGVPDETFSYPDSRPPWSGTCTFAEAGTYEFECFIHRPLMNGSIVVEPAAAGTATPTPTATPGATATPSPGATPGPGGGGGGGGAEAEQQRALKVTLATTQKGTRVRGKVDVAQAGSRLEVALKSGRQGVGRYVKAKAASGANTFSVALDTRGKRLLKRRHSLKLTVAVAITPPGGKKMVRNMNVKLRG